MVSLKRNRSRIAIKAQNPTEEFVDVITNSSAATWRGVSWQVEVAVFYGTDLVNVADYSSIKVEVRDYADRTTNLLMEKTIPVVELNPALAVSEWNAQTAHHGVFKFSSLETNLDLKGQKRRELWMVFSAIVDEDAEPITLGGGKLIMVEDGSLIDQRSVPPLGANLIPLGATYNGTGEYILNVTAGRNHLWTQGANDISVTNGTESVVETGSFIAQGATITLLGTPGALITATLRYPVYLTADEADARYLKNVAKVIKKPGILEIFHSENGLYRRIVGVGNDGLPIDYTEPTPS